MKIENGTISSITQQVILLKKKASPAVAEAPQSVIQTGEAFSIALSSKTAQLNKPQSPDEISRERVAAIRDQLASGTYNISGKDVANKILGVLKG